MMEDTQQALFGDGIIVTLRGMQLKRVLAGMVLRDLKMFHYATLTTPIINRELINA
jgi:hypothetical protein